MKQSNNKNKINLENKSVKMLIFPFAIFICILLAGIIWFISSKATVMQYNNDFINENNNEFIESVTLTYGNNSVNDRKVLNKEDSAFILNIINNGKGEKIRKLQKYPGNKINRVTIKNQNGRLCYAFRTNGEVEVYDPDHPLRSTNYKVDEKTKNEINKFFYLKNKQ